MALARSTNFLAIAMVAMMGISVGARASILKDCGPESADGQLDHVSISDCDLDKDDACNFIRGRNVTMEVEFTTKRPFSSAKISVAGLIGRFPIPFPIRPSEACGNYQVSCPSTVGQKQTLRISLPVLRTYPSLRVEAVAKLLDENARPILCAQFPIQIKG